MKYLSLLPIVLLSISNHVNAHVRWFVQQEERITPISFNTDNTTMLITLGAALFIAFCIYIERSSRHQGVINSLLNKKFNLHNAEWWFLVVALAAMFIANITQGHSLAPNIMFAAGDQWLATYPQLILALTILVSPMLAGVLIFVYFSLLGFHVPVQILGDYVFEFAGIAFALIACGPRVSKLDKLFVNAYPQFDILSLDNGARLLRFLIGLQLLVLAIHNKLLDPGLVLVFVRENPFYNFMPYLGFSDFSNLHFVYSAGIAEATFGILLIFNVAQRFVTLIVGVIFATTAIITGLHELIGHLPIFGIAAVLLANPQTPRFINIANFKLGRTAPGAP